MGTGRSVSSFSSSSARSTRRGSLAAPRQDPFDDGLSEYNDRFLAGYERVRLLGRGACAVVWLATSSSQQGLVEKGTVAIKQVAKGGSSKHRSDVEAARKEIFFGSYFFHIGGEPKLSSSKCPGVNHIAKLLDYSDTKRDVWLVMEFGGLSLTKSAYEIKGEFLRGERLYRVHHLPMLESMKRNPTALKDMLRQLISALEVLAEHHIVHSDIKPDNILIQEEDQNCWRYKLIDLGSAFAFDSPESLSLATPEYMPPEALEVCAGRGGGAARGFRGASCGGAGCSKRSIDPASRLHHQSQPWAFDTWSLGAIFLELCVGAPLWLSYKSRIADDQRPSSATMGLFAVPGRDPEKILLRQSEALRQQGLTAVLRGAAGVPLEGGVASGQDLLAWMLAWDPLGRVSPREALAHPWLRANPTRNVQR